MATKITSKSEFASMASDLGTKAKNLNSDSSSLKSTLNNIENYDGIDVSSAGKKIASNITNTLKDLDTVSTNIKNYISEIIGFDVDDFDASQVSKQVSYDDIFKTNGSREGNARVIWNFLKYKGLSDAAAAAVLGNIQAESGFNPAIVERSTGIGYGLIQWSFGRRTRLEQAAAARGVPVSDLKFQLEYLWQESLDPNSDYGKRLQESGFYQTDDVSNAAYLFHKIVEGSNDSLAAIKANRCATAVSWYNKFKGTDAGSVYIDTYDEGNSWSSIAQESSYNYSSSAGSSNSGGSSRGTATMINRRFKVSTADRNIKMANVDYDSLEDYLDRVDGTVIDVPDGLGNVHAYMGWQCITSRSSDQYKLMVSTGMNFDEEGFAKIGDRYVVATTTTFGNVGDFIDVVQSDGSVIQCVIGDIKNQNDPGCNQWGHNNGQCVVEFVVDKSSWYNTNKTVNGFHPEWNQNIDSIENKGNYFDLANKYKATAV